MSADVGLRTLSQATGARLILKKLSKSTIQRESLQSPDLYLRRYRLVCSCKTYGMRQIQVSKRSYQQNLFLSEIINYTVSKTAHLVALQLSNTGLSVQFIASKLINQSPHSQFLDRALKPDAKKLNWDAHYKWVCSTHMFRRTLDFDPSNRQ